MGIDIGSSLIVGLPYERLAPFIENEVDSHYVDEMDVIESLFDYASPYYDSPMGHWIVGHGINAYGEAVEHVVDQLKYYKVKFKDLTGLEPYVFETLNVT